MDPEDNVAVALRDLAPGEILGELEVKGPIPRGHKIALKPLAAGRDIIKYGMPVGRAATDIEAGEHVHVHNAVSGYLDNTQDHYE